MTRRRLSYEEARREAIRRGLIEPRSIGEAAVVNAADGILLGFGDEIVGAIQGPGARDRVRQSIRETRADRPVTSFAAGAGTMLVPGTLALKGARLAGLGARSSLYGTSALEGATYGFGSGETPRERLGGAAIGGLAGLGGAQLGETAGYGLSLLRRQGLNPRTRAARLANRSLQDSTPTEQDLMRRFVGQGMNPSRARSEARRLIEAGEAGRFTPEDMTNRAAALQGQGGRVEEMALEMVPGWRNDARALSATRGPGQGVVQNALNRRREGMTGRVLAQAEEAFRPRQTRSPGRGGRGRQRAGQTSIENQPPASGFQEFRERLTVARRGQNQDAYDAAYRQELTAAQRESAARRMTGGSFKQQARRSAIERADEDIARLSDDLDNLQASNAGNQAIDRVAWELADTEKARAALVALGSDTPNAASLNVRALDLYQRGLRHLSDTAGGFATEGGRNVSAVRATFMRNLQSIAPGLSEAAGTARGFANVDEALLLGRGVFQRSNEAEVDQLLRRVMSREEMDAFMVGVMEAVESKIGEGGGAVVMRLMRNKNWLSLLERSAGSKAAARRLRQRIERSALERETENFVQGGSQTTPISQDIARLTNEDELGFVSDLMNSASSGGVMPFGIRQGVNLYRRVAKPGIHNPQVASELSRMLTTRATLPKMRELASEIAAAPKTPIFTPQAQRTAAATGLFGGAGAAREAVNSPFAAELSGAPSLARAGDAFASGDYQTAATEGAIGGAAALPFVGRFAGPVTRTAAATLGLTALGSGVANAQERDRWAERNGFVRHGDYIVSPPSNNDEEFGGERPRQGSLAQAQIDGPYIVYRGVAPRIRDRNYLFERVGDDLFYRGRIIDGPESAPQAPNAARPEISNLATPGAAIAANLLTRGMLGRASPAVREASAFSAGILGGGGAEAIQGGDVGSGAFVGAGSGTVLGAGNVALRQLQRGPRPMALPQTPSPRGAVVPPDPYRVARGEQIQRQMAALNGGRPLSPNAPPVAPPRPGRLPPPRQRRAFDALSATSQGRRIGNAADILRIAQQELGQTFRSGREAVSAIRARMTSDPAFAAKMNRLYPALAALALGGAALSSESEMRDQ